MTRRATPESRPDRPSVRKKKADFTSDRHESAHLADVLSHRLLGLVSGIVGYSELLLERLSEKDQRELTMRIVESAQRIEHVLADLKYFTRTLKPELEDLPVLALMEDVTRTLPLEIAERLVLDTDSMRKSSIRADLFLTRDVLIMLIQNAAEASKTTERIGLVITEDRAGNMVTFEIANTAVLEPETEARMFEPFFTTKAKNLGMGLPMACRLAEAQGGSIHLVKDGPEGLIVMRLSMPNVGPEQE